MKALPLGKFSTRPTTAAQKTERFMEAVERDKIIGLPPLPIASVQLSSADIAELNARLEREFVRKDRLREYGIRYRARKKAELAAKSQAAQPPPG